MSSASIMLIGLLIGLLLIVGVIAAVVCFVRLVPEKDDTASYRGDGRFGMGKNCYGEHSPPTQPRLYG